MSDTHTQQDKGWCVLELMGHRKLAGWVSDDAGLLRIDVHLHDPDTEQGSAPIATQWYGQAAIYCITATSKENCLALTKSHQPRPIGRWELAPAPAEQLVADADEVDDEHPF